MRNIKKWNDFKKTNESFYDWDSDDIKIDELDVDKILVGIIIQSLNM